MAGGNVAKFVQLGVFPGSKWPLSFLKNLYYGNKLKPNQIVATFCHFCVRHYFEH